MVLLNGTHDPRAGHFNNDGIIWEDVRVPVTSIRIGAAKIPGFETFLTTLGILWFADNAEEQAYFAVQMPHGYKEGSDLFPHVHWTVASTNAGQVDWFLTYTWSNRFDSFPAETTITMPGTSSEVANQHLRTDDITMDGTGKKFSNMLVCRISRDGGQGNDTLVGDAGLLEVDFHYNADSLGSREEFVK